MTDLYRGRLLYAHLPHIGHTTKTIDQQIIESHKQRPWDTRQEYIGTWLWQIDGTLVSINFISCENQRIWECHCGIRCSIRSNVCIFSNNSVKSITVSIRKKRKNIYEHCYLKREFFLAVSNVKSAKSSSLTIHKTENIWSKNLQDTANKSKLHVKIKKSYIKIVNLYLYVVFLLECCVEYTLYQQFKLNYSFS